MGLTSIVIHLEIWPHCSQYDRYVALSSHLSKGETVNPHPRITYRANIRKILMVHQCTFGLGGVLPLGELSDVAATRGGGNYLEYVFCNGIPNVIFLLEVKFRGDRERNSRDHTSVRLWAVFNPESAPGGPPPVRITREPIWNHFLKRIV